MNNSKGRIRVPGFMPILVILLIGVLVIGMLWWNMFHFISKENYAFPSSSDIIGCLVMSAFLICMIIYVIYYNIVNCYIIQQNGIIVVKKGMKEEIDWGRIDYVIYTNGIRNQIVIGVKGHDDLIKIPYREKTDAIIRNNVNTLNDHK